MPTLGYSTQPSYGTFSQISSTTEVAVQAVVPAGGIYVTQLSAYMELYTGASAPVWLCIWNSSGTLLYSVQSNGVFYQSWLTKAVPDFFLSGGQTIYIGFATQPANGFTVPYNNTGGSYWGSQNSPPGNTTFSGTGFGTIGAYLTYTTSLPSSTPNQLQVWDGTKLRTITFWVYNGTHLRPATAYIFDGSYLRQIQ